MEQEWTARNGQKDQEIYDNELHSRSDVAWCMFLDKMVEEGLLDVKIVWRVNKMG